MTVVVRATLPTDAFELGEVLQADGPLEVELTRLGSVDSGVSLYVWVVTDDAAAFESRVRSDPRVGSLTRQDDRPGKVLYHVEWATELGGVLDSIRTHDVVVERGVGTPDEWTFRLRLADSDAVRSFREECRERDLPLRITGTSGADRPSGEGAASPSVTGPDGTGDHTDGGTQATGTPGLAEGRADTSPFREIVENLREVIWLTDPDKEEMFFVNPAYEEVWGEPRDRLFEDPQAFLDAVHPDDRERVRAALDAQAEGEYDEEYRIERPDGSIRWIRDRAVPIRDAEGEVRRVAGIAEDVTEHKKREHVLAALHETTDALLQSTADEEIAEVVARAASETLQLPIASVYFHDEDAGELRPVAWTADAEEVVGELPTFSGPESLAWDAFSDGTVRVYDDVRSQERVFDPETRIRSELVAALGTHGVLLAGDTAAGEIDEVDGEFAELLATSTETALDRVEYERHLERQNERLVALSRLNDLIRSVHGAIVDATTRAEIAANVCDTLADTDSFRAAWIGTLRNGGEVAVRGAAGPVGDAEDDRIPADEDTLTDELVGRAHRTRTVHVIHDLRDSATVDPVHEGLLESGCLAAAAVPLTAGEARYGVLLLYADRRGAFDEEVVAILRELGQTIGRAIRAVQTRNALVADSVIELEFGVTGASTFFVASSGDLECRLALEGVVALEGGRLLYYVSVEGIPTDAFRERATAADGVEAFRVIAEGDAGEVVAFRVSGESALRTLVDYGATVRSAVADHGDARITVEIPPDVDARTVLNGLQEVCASAELIGKHAHDRHIRTDQQFRRILTERLTDKQLNALRAAYFAGYFEWPRESTAEEVAEPMEVSSSTVHFHIRHGLRKLLRTFFEVQDAT